MEEWIAVPGFEGLYEAGICGRIRSLDRVDSAGRHLKGRVLRPGQAQKDRQARFRQGVT